jgi:hypothetical protein
MAADSDFMRMFAGKTTQPQPVAKPAAETKEGAEGRCPAYGFLRGLHERALELEIRLRNGNREYFPYALLGPWRFDPSVGVLLKFTGGDVLSVVLIRGSNLDAMVGGMVNLTDRGIQRHRIIYVREMDEDELGRATAGEPTIDHIEVAEFESNEELQDYLKTAAPAFAR